MDFCQKLYLLKNKQNYFRYSQLPIEKVTLSFSFKSEPSFKEFSLAFAALKLIANQQPYAIRAKKSRVHLKIRKGIPLGVKVTLRNQNLDLFLMRLIWEILPNIKGLRLSQRNLKNSRDSFSLQLADIFLFSELKKFYFYFNTLPVLNITIVLSPCYTKSKENNKLVSTFLQFPF